MLMQIEDHILWKIATTYDLLYRTRKKLKDGDLAWEEYAALMEPKCIEVMTELLECLEAGDFLDHHRMNASLPKGKGEEYPWRDRTGFPFPSVSESILKRYEILAKTLHESVLISDSEKKTHELIIGFDMFVGWMHDSWLMSRWVMKQRPITGNWDEDYEIARHTMYLASYKRDADDAIAYLRMCSNENRFINLDERQQKKIP
jgi:hypothetical protein